MASVSFYKIKEIIEDESIPREQVAETLVKKYAKHSVYINADVPEWETLEERNQYMMNLKKQGLTVDEICQLVNLSASQVREIIYVKK